MGKLNAEKEEVVKEKEEKLDTAKGEVSIPWINSTMIGKTHVCLCRQYSAFASHDKPTSNLLLKSLCVVCK